jgi:uncharacterized protein (UPF0332 family)
LNVKDFWNQDQKHRDQKFYISLCLLETALNDYAIARELCEKNVMHWSVTCHYYSLFHSLRLVGFLFYGDFPKNHKDLSYLFKNGDLKNQKPDSIWTWTPEITNRVSNKNSIKFNIRDISTFF